jgi:hypothetical protein
MNTKIKLGAAAVLGLGLATLAATSGIASAGTTAGAGTSSTSCGVLTSTHNGMLVIQGSILSPVPLQGSYHFKVQSSGGGGNSNISQGGDFSAVANQQTTLGQVMINTGSKYQVDLDVTADGKRLDCDNALSQYL